MFQLGEPTISAFYANIVRLRIGETGSTYLLDGDSHILYHQRSDREPGRIGEIYPNESIINELQAGKAGSQRFRNAEQQDIVVAYTPVKDTP